MIAKLGYYNLHNLGSLPFTIKILIFVSVFVVTEIVLYCDSDINYIEYQLSLDKINNIKKDISNIKYKINLLNQGNKKSNKDVCELSVNKNIEFFNKIIPNVVDVAGILKIINICSVKSLVKNTSFNILKEKLANDFIELPVAVKILGTYTNLVNFSSYILSSTQLTNINKVTIKKHNNLGDNIFVMHMQLNFVFYAHNYK